MFCTSFLPAVLCVSVTLCLSWSSSSSYSKDASFALACAAAVAAVLLIFPAVLAVSVTRYNSTKERRCFLTFEVFFV